MVLLCILSGLAKTNVFSLDKLKNTGFPRHGGCVGKIDRCKRLIFQQTANRVCDAACSDKAMDGFYQSFLRVKKQGG